MYRIRYPLLAFAWMALSGISQCDRDAVDLPVWEATRTARAGTEDGPGALTSVAGLTVARDGRVYVSQPQDRTIRVYAPNGAYLWAFGREGEGPGEFAWPLSLGWRGDTLWVSDPAQRRISLFDVQGRFIRSVSFVREDSLTDGKPHVPSALFNDGSVLGEWLPHLVVLSGPDPISVPLVRFTEKGQPLNAIGRVESRNEFARLRSGTSSTYIPQPFTDSEMMDVFPDGSGVVLVARPASASSGTASFTVTRINASGSVAFSKRYDYTPIRLSDKAVDAAIEQEVGGLSEARIRTPEAAVLRRSMRQVLYRPRHLPPITAVRVGRDGSIWLRREEQGREKAWWTVLDSSGQVLARVQLPAKLDVRYADLTGIWGVELDELDVPTLARFTLDRGD